MATSRTSRKRRSARHATHRRGRRIARWLTAGVALAAIAGSAWFALNSSLFAVRRVDVHGNVRLTDVRVTRLLGLPAGENLIRLSLGETEARLESHPWIARATVSRTLPGTLVVSVGERGPVAAVRMGDGWALLAGDATMLGTRDRRPDLPLITTPVRPADPGARLAGLLPSLRVLSHLPVTVEAVRARPGDDGVVTLVLGGGTRVLYGGATEWAAKNDALVALLRWATRQGIEAARIDVRAPRAPALAPAAVASAQEGGISA